MRLIDADALLKEHCADCPIDMRDICAADPLCASAMWIKEAATVDAVPVVRCKDCKHWDCYGGTDSHKGDCLELIGLESCMYEDDFCSYGERRTE